MELRTDAVQQICRAVSRQTRDYARNLSLSFIVHHAGQHLESLSLAGQELLSHPAAEQALRLLNTQTKSEGSNFIGLNVWRENIFFGLASSQNMMALSTLNIDEFQNLRDVRAQAWAMAWHAINLSNQRNNKNYKNAFHNGVVTLDINDEDLASANLRADAFSAVMCTVEGDKDAIRRLAERRSLESIERHAGKKPEFYPFAIALEATQFAYNEMQQHPPSKKKLIQTVLQLADNIGKTYDELSIQQWMYFCKPAQDMAWRGEKKDIILGAAVSTSQDTYIRATGFLVSETTKITPTTLLNLEQIHSPFAEEKYNKRLHETMIERAFADAVRAGLIKLDGTSFMEAAHKQNEEISDGHILGWCAAALQAAGRAFENAIARGSKSPEEEALREFKDISVRTTWESLKEIGENIIEQYRQGYATTFSDIIDFCGERPAFAGISSSIAFTMKDPSYLKKLDIANDLRAMPAPEPTAPSVKAPSYSAAPRAPSLGLGSTNNGSVSATSPPPQKKQTQTDEETRQ